MDPVFVGFITGALVAGFSFLIGYWIGGRR